MAWAMECDNCGKTFNDGISAGWHESWNPGHRVSWIDTDYADEHECGQLRIGVAGEQRPLVPLPDYLIPTEGVS